MNFNELNLSLEMGLIYGFVAVGLYLTFRVINYTDLTCDGSFVLGAAVTAVCIQSGYNSWLAMLFATLAGGLAGGLTWTLHVVFKITDLLSGILVAFMLYSVNLRIMGGFSNIVITGGDISGVDGGGLEAIYAIIGETTGLIMGAIINSSPLGMCILTIGLISYFLTTDFGLALRSVGKNKTFAHSVGINVAGISSVALVLSNGLIACSGSLFVKYQNFADINSGIGTVIIGLASIIIGEKLINTEGRKYAILLQICSCFLGSIIYRILMAFALHNEALGLKSYDLNLIMGILILMIMQIDRRKI